MRRQASIHRHFKRVNDLGAALLLPCGRGSHGLAVVKEQRIREAERGNLCLVVVGRVWALAGAIRAGAELVLPKPKLMQHVGVVGAIALADAGLFRIPGLLGGGNPGRGALRPGERAERRGASKGQKKNKGSQRTWHQVSGRVYSKAGMPGRAIPWIKVLVHLVCLLPLLYLLRASRSGALAAEADPVNWITHFTGNWALWILLADLAITPVRRIHSSLAWLVRLRRMVGLYVFFYATLHLATYVFLFSGYDVPTALAGLRAGKLAEPWRQLVAIWPTMLDDLEKRRFIQVGLLAWILLLLLTVTSPQRILRWMGGKNWQRLHRLIYLAGFAAVVHYWWLVKKGVLEPWKDTAVLFFLLGIRLVFALQKRLRRTPRTVARAQA